MQIKLSSKILVYAFDSMGILKVCFESLISPGQLPTLLWAILDTRARVEAVIAIPDGRIRIQGDHEGIEVSYPSEGGLVRLGLDDFLAQVQTVNNDVVISTEPGLAEARKALRFE